MNKQHESYGRIIREYARRPCYRRLWYLMHKDDAVVRWCTLKRIVRVVKRFFLYLAGEVK